MKSNSLNLSQSIEVLMNPLLFLAFSIIPQLILLAVNLHSYGIVKGNMDDTQKLLGAQILSVELVMMLLFLAIPLIMFFLKKKIPWAVNFIFLAVSVGYLCFFVIKSAHLIPQSVQTWILPEERIIFYQFIAICPAVFYSIIRIVAVDFRISAGRDIAITAGMAALPPFFFYIFAMMPGHIFHIPYSLSSILLPVFLVISTLVMIFAVSRLILIMYNLMQRKSQNLTVVLYIIFGLAMPIGGLILNYFIPFPADFQSAGIYFFTFLNGIFLAIPTVKNERINTAAAICRFALYPFTLYFFFIFLPFLPLSLPLIVIAGAGFLILSPTILFILHTKKISHDFKYSFRNIIFKNKIFIASASICILPLLITVNALMHKLAINQAIDYIYEADYVKNTEFKGSTYLVKNGLLSIRDMKAGIYLPFISGYYEWLVFDNMVMPDKKLVHLYKAFFGEDIPEIKRSNFSGNFGPLFGMQSSWSSNIEAETVFSNSTDVTISSIDHKTLSEQGFKKTSVTINMKNYSKFETEFRTSISLPEGAFVSGYWLNIDNDKVPGKLFDKKTAMWVYEMIKNTRRDPGLLYYNDNRTLHLKVFPFSGGQRRITEIEFIYPDTISGSIKIGGQSIVLNKENNRVSPVISSMNDGHVSLLLPGGHNREKYKILRKPYLHFVIDWSAKSNLTKENIIDKIEAIAQKYPDVKYCSITLANYETLNITGGIISLDLIQKLRYKNLQNSLTPQGGFCRDRAIKEILLSYQTYTSDKNRLIDGYLYYPQIYVIRDSKSFTITEDNMQYFTSLLCDVNGYYQLTDNNQAEKISFDGLQLKEIKKTPILVKQIVETKGGIQHPFTQQPGSSKLFFCDVKDNNFFVQIFNPQKNSFENFNPVQNISSTTIYASALQVNALSLKKVYNPSLTSDLLPEIVSMSKKTGILTPATTYIVVENNAQWEMLTLKEKQKLEGKDVYEPGSADSVNSPEPSVFLMIGLLLFSLCGVRAKSYLFTMKLNKTSI